MACLLSTLGCQNQFAVWEADIMAYNPRVKKIKNEIDNEEWKLVIDGGYISPALII